MIGFYLGIFIGVLLNRIYLDYFKKGQKSADALKY